MEKKPSESELERFTETVDAKSMFGEEESELTDIELLTQEESPEEELTDLTLESSEEESEDAERLVKSSSIESHAHALQPDSQFGEEESSLTEEDTTED